HMLFDWNGSFNIDVVVVLNQNTVFGSGISAIAVPGCQSTSPSGSNINCLYDGHSWGFNDLGTAPVASNPWMLTSVDQAGGDGVSGTQMPAGGPFQFFNANFSIPGNTLVLTSGTVCNPTVDVIPDQFTFADVPSGATPSTVYSADAKFPGNSTLVSGLGSGVSSPISISGGEYSKDGGTTWTSTAGTVQNGDTVKVHQTSSANSDGTTTNATLSIGGVSDIFSVKVIDKKPDAFTFTDTPTPIVATSTLVESNTITVSGMDGGQTTPISITCVGSCAGGEYSKNGGTYTSAAGTVTNGDTVKVHQISSANAATPTDVILTLGQVSDGTAISDTFTVLTAGGYSSTGNNFTMMDDKGNVAGGTNDVTMTWDKQFNTSTSDPVTPATAHMQLSSTNAFFQNLWTAHHIRVFGPGTYIINVDCTVAQLENGTCTPNALASKNYTFTVGADQVGAHMLFDWNGTYNIDVIEVWNKNAVFGPSSLFTGPNGFNDPSTSWDLMSSDTAASCLGALSTTGTQIPCSLDGQSGTPMIDGPFIGFSANFNIKFVGTTAPSNYTPTVNISDPSNMSGCSISTRSTNGLERGDWWLVAGFLTWLGGIRLRFNRRQTKS
ncbi:MAG: hypothetical protein WB402_02640, partial [Sulfuricaulis sp.]